jgi:molybdopterin converting factor small subunit
MNVRMFGTLSLAIGGVKETQIHVPGTCTAREALRQLVAAYPHLSGKVLGDGQELVGGLQLFVGDRSIRLLDGLSTLLREGDELLLLPLLGGG